MSVPAKQSCGLHEPPTNPQPPSEKGQTPVTFLHVVCARGCRARVRVGDETHTASLPPRRAAQRLLVSVSRANRDRAFTLPLAGGGGGDGSARNPHRGDGQMRRIATIVVYAVNRARAADRAAGRR